MARRIAVEIVGDASSLERAFRRSTVGAEQFNRRVSETGKHQSAFHGLAGAAESAAGLIGVAGLGEAVRSSFERMQEIQRTSALTAAAIKSTGDVSNVTAGHVDELAKSLAGMSGADTEVIASSENMLLRFTKVHNEAGRGNDIFDRATTAALNLSAATGGNMTQAALRVGKALQDPVKGLGALSRVGVQFTTQQKDQIKQMVKSGDTMGAQKLILDQLTVRYGGAARAAGATFGGQMNRLQTTLKNLGAQILTNLLPSITKIVSSMTRWLSNTRNQKTIVDLFRGAVGALKTGIDFLRGAFGFLSGVMGGNRNAIVTLIAIYGGWKIAKLIGSVVSLGRSFVGLAAGLFTKTIPAVEATAVAEGEAAAATGGLATALGPAVLGAAALAAGYALGSLIYQIPIVKQLADEAADSIAHMLGYTNPLAQYAGKLAPTQNMAARIRGQAAQLEQRGLSPAAAARALEIRYPRVAARDIETYAGVRGRPPANVHITFNGITDPNQIQRAINDTIARHYRRTPHVR